MEKSLDRKLKAIHADPARCREFILADAKDADMAFGVTAPGEDPRAAAECVRRPCKVRYKNLEEYREQIREVIQQGIVDIMLMSCSNVEQIAIREERFVNSPITPAARANDTTDVWIPRGGKYLREPSRPFRSATLPHIMYGHCDPKLDEPVTGADLGLYSVTFNNDLEADYSTISAFHEFRLEAERRKFRYFLEVFAPNVECGISKDKVGHFMNDHIIRMLAGVPSTGRPLFLKIPYMGPAALEELVSYDPHLIVGILGGSSGTARDAFQLLHDAKQHGARVALYGRKINLADDPLLMIKLLRQVADEELEPKDAVRIYHEGIRKSGIKPRRMMLDDMELSTGIQRYG